MARTTLRAFYETLRREACQDRIVDVSAGWGAALERFNRVNEIVAVDLAPDGASEWLSTPNVTVMQGDGTKLPFADGEFDVAFSNSVIEHVPRHFAAFADEMRRVAHRYYLQTPNRYFPIEPHYQLPLFQFLPERARRWLNARYTLGWQAKGHSEEITLLSARDLQRLFPNAEIHRERVLGLTKSLIAVRR